MNTDRRRCERLKVVAAIMAALLTHAAGVSAQAQRPPAKERGVGVRPAAAAQVRELPTKAKRFALVIGVDDYEDTQVTTLGGATNDARALADALVRYAGFPADQVTLLASDQPAERRPTRGNILRRLSNLRGLVPKDGMLLVSFAGHGIERNGEAYLLPSDAQVSGDVRLLEETAVNVTRMKEGVRETGVGQVIFILDACRNDPSGRSDADNPLTPAYTRGFNFDVRNREVTAFATLYATAVGQRAYELKEKRQGYFTWGLVEALKGRAANERGEVTLASLVRYMQEQVPKHVRLDLGKEQKPFAVIEGYKADELVIAAPPSASASAAAASAAPAPSAEDNNRAAADNFIWEAIRNSTNPRDFKAYLKEFPAGRHVEQAKLKLRDLEAQLAAAQGNPGGQPKPTVTLSSAQAVVIPGAPATLIVYGDGWDGGTDVKVFVNGRDVSELIDSQNSYSNADLIQLKGSVKQLNLLDGKNEVSVVVNGVTSNTTVFRQAIK